MVVDDDRLPRQSSPPSSTRTTVWILRVALQVKPSPLRLLVYRCRSVIVVAIDSRASRLTVAVFLSHPFSLIPEPPLFSLLTAPTKRPTPTYSFIVSPTSKQKCGLLDHNLFLSSQAIQSFQGLITRRGKSVRVSYSRIRRSSANYKSKWQLPTGSSGNVIRCRAMQAPDHDVDSKSSVPITRFWGTS